MAISPVSRLYNLCQILNEHTYLITQYGEGRTGIAPSSILKDVSALVYQDLPSGCERLYHAIVEPFHLSDEPLSQKITRICHATKACFGILSTEAQLLLSPFLGIDDHTFQNLGQQLATHYFKYESMILDIDEDNGQQVPRRIPLSFDDRIQIATGALATLQPNTNLVELYQYTRGGVDRFLENQGLGQAVPQEIHQANPQAITTTDFHTACTDALIDALMQMHKEYVNESFFQKMTSAP